MSPAPFKRVVMEEISSAVLKLEAHTVPKILEKIVSEVVDALEIEKKLGMTINWIDKIFRKIEEKKEHFEWAKQL